ncbi:MAG: DUF1629 domain-containing protein [Bacteroidota bacterium]
MNIQDYYTLGSKLSSTTFQAHPIGLKSKEGGIGDNEKLVLGEYYEINFPVTFKQEYGKKLQDVLDTGTAILFLISTKMKTILEENELSGWKTFPVRVQDKKGNEVDGYFGFSITGRCGSIDYDKSDVIKKSLVQGGPVSKYYKGLYVGLDEWDRSDFSMPKGTFHPIVTKKAMQAMKKAKLTNIRFEKLSEIETMEIIVSSHRESISKNLTYF